MIDDGFQWTQVSHGDGEDLEKRGTGLSVLESLDGMVDGSLMWETAAAVNAEFGPLKWQFEGSGSCLRTFFTQGTSVHHNRSNTASGRDVSKASSCVCANGRDNFIHPTSV